MIAAGSSRPSADLWSISSSCRASPGPREVRAPKSAQPASSGNAPSAWRATVVSARPSSPQGQSAGVHPDFPDPDHLPDEARAWAREHRELLEMIVEELLQTGTWPSVKALTRKLARGNQPIALSRVLGTMPKPLGFVDHYPDRVVLLVFGLRMTHAGHKLLAGFLATLRLAADRYAGEEERPSITRDDAARGTMLEDPYVRALSEILLREAPFLGSGSGGLEEHWSREVTDDIVRYWDARTAEDYLRLRADELRGSPQLGWQPVLLDPPAGATPAGPVSPLPGPGGVQPLLPGDPERAEVRDAFVSHAGEDEQIARALASALQARGHSVWYDEAELCVGDSLTEEIDRGPSDFALRRRDSQPGVLCQALDASRAAGFRRARDSGPRTVCTTLA